VFRENKHVNIPALNDSLSNAEKAVLACAVYRDAVAVMDQTYGRDVACRRQRCPGSSPVRSVLERPRYVVCEVILVDDEPTVLARFLAAVAGNPPGTLWTRRSECFLSLFIEAVYVGLIDAYCSNRDAVSRRPAPLRGAIKCGGGGNTSTAGET